MANMYFNEELMQELHSRYESLTRQELEYYWDQVKKCCIGTLNTAKMYRFSLSRDELLSACFEALVPALRRFDPNFVTSKGKKATLFNYISLTAKRAMQYSTIRNSVHNAGEIFDDIQIESHSLIDFSSLNKHLHSLIPINKPFFSPMIHVLTLFMENKEDPRKRKLYPLLIKHGSPSQIRSFFKFLKKHENIIVSYITE